MMQDHGYYIIVQKYREYEYAAYVPDLLGCLGDGNTPQSAVEDAIWAINEWLDEAKRLNKPIPLPTKHEIPNFGFLDN